jgi:hypothetical protein
MPCSYPTRLLAINLVTVNDLSGAGHAVVGDGAVRHRGGLVEQHVVTRSGQGFTGFQHGCQAAEHKHREGAESAPG